MKKTYNSETGEVTVQNEKEEKKPEPVLIEGLIDSFCHTYAPCPSEDVADEVFTLGALRRHFNAFTIADARWVDALPEYLRRLASHGFHLQNTYSGEPAIFVRARSYE